MLLRLGTKWAERPRGLPIVVVALLAGCSHDTQLPADPTLPDDPAPSALTAEVLDGWAQKGWLVARSRLELRFDNTAGTQAAVARIRAVLWGGSTWTFTCEGISLPCPEFPIAAGEHLDHVLESGVSGGEAFNGEKPDCSTTTEDSTTSLEIHLELDGVASILTAEVAEYCIACSDELLDCVSYPSDPPE